MDRERRGTAEERRQRRRLRRLARSEPEPARCLICQKTARDVAILVSAGPDAVLCVACIDDLAAFVADVRSDA